MAEITLEALKKHIAKYGPEGVMDAARDWGFPVAALVELQEQIDKLPRQPRHRKSAEARVRSWLGLTEEEAAA